MSEWTNSFQENAARSAEPASLSAELPTVESMFAWSGDMRPKACRSASCLHRALAAFASIAAVALLVFFCSRVYRRRALQGIESRRLASSEGRDALVDACNTSSEEEGEQHHQNPPNLMVGDEGNLPIKKRLLLRVAETGMGGAGRTTQRQEQQRHDEPPEVPCGLSPVQRDTRVKQRDASPSPANSSLTSGQKRMPAQFDTTAGLLSLHSRPHDPDLGSDARQTATLEVRRLKRWMRRLKRQQQRERRHYQRRELYLQQKHEQDELYHQQQQQQYLTWHYLYWQQQQQQQLLLKHQEMLQYLLQKHQHQYAGLLPGPHQHPLPQQGHQQFVLQDSQEQHLVQQQHLLPQEQQGTYMFQHQERQEYLLQQEEQRQHLHQQQEQLLQQQAQLHFLQPPGDTQPGLPEGRRVALQEEREQQNEKEKGEPQAEPALPQDSQQHQAFQNADQFWVHSLEDEWIDAESPSAEAPQPGTSQPVLESSSPPAAAAGYPAAEHFSMQVVTGSPPASLAASPAARTAGASRDEAAAVPVEGGKATSPTAVRGWETSGLVSAAPTTTGESTDVVVPASSGSVTDDSPTGAGTAAAGTATTAASSSAIAAYKQTPPMMVLSRDAIAAVLEHPFVRLPKRSQGPIPASHFVDLSHAVTTRPGRRDLMPLLQRAHDLLTRQLLCFPDLKQLSTIAAGLIEHAISHQHYDLSTQKTSRAVERLGLRFLLFDAVVSCFIVLGQNVEMEYWKVFVDAVPHGAPALPRRGRHAGKQTFAYSLAQELSRAVQILKMGRRPDPVQLMKLKRMLICLPQSPARFRRRDFDDWREDNHSHFNGP